MSRTIDCRKVAKFVNEGMSYWDGRATAEKLGIVTDGRFLIDCPKYAKRVLPYLKMPKPKFGYREPKPLGQKQIDNAFGSKNLVECEILDDCTTNHCADVWFYGRIVQLIRKLFPKADTYQDLVSKKLVFKVENRIVAVVMGNLDSANEYYRNLEK